MMTAMLASCGGGGGGAGTDVVDGGGGTGTDVVDGGGTETGTLPPEEGQGTDQTQAEALNWSDPKTWGDTLPTAGAAVVIPLLLAPCLSRQLAMPAPYTTSTLPSTIWARLSGLAISTCLSAEKS